MNPNSNGTEAKVSKQCPIPGCFKAFTTQAGFSYHRRFGHGAARAYRPCPFPSCGKNFSSQAGLSNHLSQYPQHKMALLVNGDSLADIMNPEGSAVDGIEDGLPISSVADSDTSKEHLSECEAAGRTGKDGEQEPRATDEIGDRYGCRIVYPINYAPSRGHQNENPELMLERSLSHGFVLEDGILQYEADACVGETVPRSQGNPKPKDKFLSPGLLSNPTPSQFHALQDIQGFEALLASSTAVALPPSISQYAHLSSTEMFQDLYTDASVPNFYPPLQIPRLWTSELNPRPNSSLAQTSSHASSSIDGNLWNSSRSLPAQSDLISDEQSLMTDSDSRNMVGYVRQLQAGSAYHRNDLSTRVPDYYNYDTLMPTGPSGIFSTAALSARAAPALSSSSTTTFTTTTATTVPMASLLSASSTADSGPSIDSSLKSQAHHHRQLYYQQYHHFQQQLQQQQQQPLYHQILSQQFMEQFQQLQQLQQQLQQQQERIQILKQPEEAHSPELMPAISSNSKTSFSASMGLFSTQSRTPEGHYS